MARCSQCFTELPADAPEGICPACLMRGGLSPATIPEGQTSRTEAILFTDIADSTGFKARAGSAVYSRNLKLHNALFEQSIKESTGGSIIKHTGDGFFAHFTSAEDAVVCGLRFQRALAAEVWPAEAIRVRIGINIGEVEPIRMADRTDLVGSPVDEAARITSIAAGGQILLSGDVALMARPPIKDHSVLWKRHGLYKLKGIDLPVEIWQVADAVPGLLPAPPGAVDSAIPTEIGPYRILEQLGEGGMGTVYKAEQRRPVKRIVALKVIKLGLGSAEVIARFESERQALARMDHSNIAKVLDAGQTETGQPYFAMEYVPGVPLTKFADDKKLSVRQRLELFKDVCAAIAHAHTKAVIPRDVKSSNVLAYLSDEKPCVKVIDFGIAKALTGDRLTDQTFNTDRGRAIGTFDSMSPEQAEGSPDIDTRTNVYSLGVLLYELLTGAPPFDRATLAKAADLEIRRIIREVEPPRPSTRLSSLGDAGKKIAESRREKLGVLERELRSELEWIPLMAMRKDRDRRYANPLEFSDDIENYLEGRPPRAGPEKVSYRLRKFLHRNRGTVAAAAAIVLLLVGGIISTSLGMSWALRERAVAETARQSEMTAKDRAIASAQEARDARARADQRSLLVAQGQVSLGDALARSERWAEAKTVYHKAYESFVDLQVSPLSALTAGLMANDASPQVLLTLAGHQGEVRSVAISPDGRTALSASDDMTLKLWDLATGKELKAYAGHTGIVDSVAFSPDGRTALSGSEDKTLKLWDLSGGNAIRTFTGHTASVRGVAISPDGRSALSGGDDKTLRLWDLASGKEIRALNSHTKAVDSVAFSPGGRTALSGSEDHTLKLWDVASGGEIRTLTGHTGEVCSVVFSPDGHSVLSGSKDKTLKLWDPATGKEIRSFGDDIDIVFTVAMTPDGQSAFSGGFFAHFMVWDLNTGKQIGRNDSHTSFIWSLAVSPDGLAAVSGSADKTLKVWDFSRATTYWDLEPKVQQAQRTLQNTPDDAAALAILGDWYAFRGVNDWGAEFLEMARAGGAKVSSLTLARCYWSLDKLVEARREFQKAMEAGEASADYLNLCIGAVGDSIPATQPN